MQSGLTQLIFKFKFVSQAILRTRVLLLQQGANSVLVNFLGELFMDGVVPNFIETETAVQVL
jgi:hypothetical protein